jgi:sarcosine/dimethylglycine N-methyltransferase
VSDAASAIETARDYYNSDDADNFYATIWGGEDIHIGLYEDDVEPIADASRRTVARMAELAAPIDADTRVLDIGSGYAGSARWLAAEFGCRCTALNLSERENERGRELNAAAGLADRIEVIDGAFEDLPFDDASFDLLWSQDAFLHSGDRPRVLAEAVRVLAPGGRFVFTDPMRADDCPEGVLDPILDRLHLTDLGAPGFYRETLEGLGLECVTFEDHGHQLPRHYGRVRAELLGRREELKGKVSDAYVERMAKGLEHWVNGGRAGHLAWGIFVFRKP